MVKSFNSRDIRKRLIKDGWVLGRTKGDHHQFKHPTRPGLVTLVHPKKDIPLGTLKSVFRQAGWEWPP